MREIKFRIWEKKQRVMEFFGPKWSLGDEYYVLGFLFEGEEEKIFECTSDAYDSKDEDIVLMQYTGLKDKNGREIYEGDILTIQEDSECRPDRKWSPNVGKRCFVIYDDEMPGFRGHGNFLFQYLIPFNGIIFEIIGNIYENPDLLK